MKKKIIVPVLLFLGILFIFSLIIFINKNKKEQKKLEQQNNKIRLVASFYPIYFLVKSIVKDKAEVINLTPAGVEPHEFEPKTKDIGFIEKSKILFLNGSGVEIYEEKLRNLLKNNSVNIISLGSPFAMIEFDKGVRKTKDPHVWLDPVLYGKMAEKVFEEISSFDKKNKDYYRKNLEEFLREIKELDNLYKNNLKSCRLNKIITSHTAFAYLAKRYGFSQIGISGLSHEDEPSVAELKEITEIIKKEGIKYIFAEELVSSEWSEVISKETGAKLLLLSPIESISKEKQNEKENYFTLQRKNLENLKKALECKN